MDALYIQNFAQKFVVQFRIAYLERRLHKPLLQEI